MERADATDDSSSYFSGGPSHPAGHLRKPPAVTGMRRGLMESCAGIAVGSALASGTREHASPEHVNRGKPPAVAGMRRDLLEVCN